MDLKQNLKPLPEIASLRKLLKNGTFVNLSQSYENLRDERNDINHGGYVVNSRSSERLRNKLQETYSKVKEIIFRDNI